MGVHCLSYDCEALTRYNFERTFFVTVASYSLFLPLSNLKERLPNRRILLQEVAISAPGEATTVRSHSNEQIISQHDSCYHELECAAFKCFLALKGPGT